MCRPAVAACCALSFVGAAEPAAQPLVTATAGVSGGYTNHPGAVPGEPASGSRDPLAPFAVATATLRARLAGDSIWSGDFRGTGAWERAGTTGAAASTSLVPAGEVICRPGRAALRGGGAWQERWYRFAGDGGRATPFGSRGWEGWAATEFPLAPRPGYGGFVEYRQAARVHPGAIVVTSVAEEPRTGRRRVSDRTVRAGGRMEPAGWCEVQLAWEEIWTTGNALGWQSESWRAWDASRGRGGTVQVGVRPHPRLVLTGGIQRSVRRYAERQAEPGPGADRLELTVLSASSSWAFHDQVAAVVGWQQARCASPTAAYRLTATRVTAGIRVAATFIPRQRFP